MGTMASQIASLTIVYSTVYSGADQRKHQSSASLVFVRGIQIASNAENVSIWWRHCRVIMMSDHDSILPMPKTAVICAKFYDWIIKFIIELEMIFSQDFNSYIVTSSHIGYTKWSLHKGPIMQRFHVFFDVSQQTVEQTIEVPVNWDTTVLLWGIPDVCLLDTKKVEANQDLSMMVDILQTTISHFKCIFLKELFCLISNALKIISGITLKIKSWLIEMMAWHQIGNKPSP